MPEQDLQPQEIPANPAAPPATTNVGDKTYINKMRQNLAQEISGLRKQVLQVQLQSMKIMQQSIQMAFKVQTDKTSEQIAQQSTDLQKQLEEETEALTTTATEIDNSTDETNSGTGQMQAFNDIVQNAVLNAQRSVDNAMQAAQNIMNEAENLLKNPQ